MIRRLVVAVILLAAAASSRADVPDMRGKWKGFGRSVATGDINGDAQLDVIKQSGHRFQGFFMDSWGNKGLALKVHGTVTENGVVNITGTDPSGNTLHAHGVVQHGTSQAAPHVAAARYRILDPAGVEIDRGIFTLVHMFGSFDWNNDQTDSATAIDGNWHGFWAANEFGVTAAFTHAPNTTMVTGTFHTELLSLDIVGTMSPPSITDGTSNTLMLGVTDDGKVAILIGMLLPAVQDQPKMLVGNGRVWNSFFDVFTELVHGKNLSHSGSYTLTFGPN